MNLNIALKRSQFIDSKKEMINRNEELIGEISLIRFKLLNKYGSNFPSIASNEELNRLRSLTRRLNDPNIDEFGMKLSW